MNWRKISQTLTMLGVITALFPFALAVMWSAVTRQWMLLMAMYGVWFGAMAMMYPLLREYQRERP